MSVPSGTNQELLEEISALNQRIKELEQSESDLRQAGEALSESEMRLGRLVENSPGVVCQFTVGPGGSVSFPYMNKALLAHAGVSSEEAMRDSSVLIGKIHPDDMKMFRGIILESAKSMKPSHAVLRFLKDGQYIWLEARATPERMPDGTILWNGFFRDITGRRQERESLLRTQFAMDRAPDSILWVDDMGSIVYANDFACSSLGYTRDEMLAMKVFDIDPDFPPGDQWEQHKRDLRRLGTMSFETRHIAKDGRIFPVEVRTNYFKFDDRWLACAFDREITERKQTEEALTASEEKFRDLFDNAVEGIYRTTPDGHVVDANMAVARMIGYESPEEFIGNITDIARQIYVDPEDRKKALGLLTEKGRFDNFECRLRRKDGSVFWVTMNARLTHLKDGTPCFEGFVVDITKRKKAENALRRYQFMVENAKQEIYLVEPDGRLSYVNRAAAESLGYTQEEMLAMGVPGFDPVFGPVFREHFLDLKSRDMPPFETTHITRDGRRIVKEMKSVYLTIDDKEYVCGFGVDITERKQAEEALRTSHQRVLDIIEFLPDPTFVIDAERKVVAWNRAMEEMTGVGKEDMIGRGDYAYAVPFYGEPRPMAVDLVFERDVEKVRQYNYAVMPEGVLLAEGYARQLNQGKGAFLSAKASPLCDLQGNVMGAIESIRDITAQKSIVDELQESEERYRTAIESSNDAVVMIKKGVHVYVNRKFLDIFGFDRTDQVLGTPVGVVTHPDDREKVHDIMRRRQLGESVPPRYEFKGIRTNGDVVFIEVSAASTMYKGDPITLVYLRDITDRKRLEDQLRQAQNLESIGTLAGGIAHDFNNLLMSIVGNISVARMRTSPDADSYHFLAEAERASLAGADLTSRLITFARGGEPVMKAISINRVIKEGTDSGLAGSAIHAECSLPKDLLPVRADETQIKQVIHNIVTNAREAMPQGGTIKVMGANIVLSPEDMPSLPPGDYVKIAIEDQGKGIREEDLPKIYDPYFTTKGMGSEKGMGLGLAVVYSIIKRHSGHIAIESAPGRGTTVNIYLPAHRTEKGTAERPGGASGSFRGRILFMDDEKMIRDVNEKILENLGYKAALAANGAEAVQLYRNALDSGEPFDAVILDLAIREGMGGRETIRQLLSLDPRVKAIACSGYIDDPVISDYAQYGFKGSLTKPHKVEDLEALLQKIITDPAGDTKK